MLLHWKTLPVWIGVSLAFLMPTDLPHRMAAAGESSDAFVLLYADNIRLPLCDLGSPLPRTTTSALIQPSRVPIMRRFSDRELSDAVERACRWNA